MERTAQDYLNLLNETVKFYSEDTSRRATTGGGCMYITKDNRNCAVGRCMTKKALDNLIGCSLAFYDVSRRFKGIDNALKENYKGYSEYFWNELQILHDDEKFWSKYGLKVEGIKYLDYLKRKYVTNKN